MMTTLTDRITRFLLGRLRRHAIQDAYERAAEAGLLESAFVDRPAESGIVWKLSAQMPLELTGDDDMDEKRIAKLLRRSFPSSAIERPVDRLVIPDDDALTGVRSMPKHRRELEEQGHLVARMPTVGVGGTMERAEEGRAAERDRLLRLLRRNLSMPPADVAVALAVARAVGESGGSLEELFAWLRRPDPMMIMAVPLEGFEERFGTMLEDGRIIPRSISQSDGFGHYSLSGRFTAVPEHSQSMITFGGLAIRKISDGMVRHSLAKARARRDVPIVIADESGSQLAAQVTSSADLILRLAHIDRALIAELLHICCGIAPRAAFAAMSRTGLDPRGIGLDDLTLAVRPGRSADRIIDILKVLGQRGDTDDKDPRADKSDKSKSNKKNINSGPDNSKAAHRFELIQPAMDMGSSVEGNTDTATRQFDLSIETLTGYGAAKDWALDLKADLPLWRDKRIAWSDLSSRLLLSGPPGTSKTTFAKALCNTLEIPMLATSVAHWLEAGYLGDVLKLMSSAFEAAQAHAPTILFIDEFDNIGCRNSDGGNADYWNSVINRLLQLLDGAGKLEGVIVVATTNHPDCPTSAPMRQNWLN